MGKQSNILTILFKKHWVMLCLSICSFGYQTIAQSVGISNGVITPDTSSILEIRSTSKGVLIPRLTTAQRNAIATPATGLMIFNTTTNAFNYYNSSSWIELAASTAMVNSITGTTNRVSIGGTSTNPTVDIASNYAGQTSITTLGTVSTGTWNGSLISSAFGGTGNGFTKFSGPTTSEKTFILPDASATILTSNAAVTAAQGGTGISSYTIGDLLYASGTSTLSKLAGVTTGNALLSGGVGAAPSWGKIDLTSHITGTLPVTNGGTGATTLTGILKGNGTSAFTAATAGTDYVVPNASITGGTNTKITYDNKGLVTAGTQAAASDLSNGTTGSGSIVLSTSPTLTTPNLGVASSTSETISGTAGNGFLELQTQSSAPASGATNSLRLYSSAGTLSWKKQTDGFNRNFASVLTADRTYTLPDASGTIPVSASGNIALSASGNISFTGTLPVANGGTGATTLTGLLKGNGTSAFTAATAGTDYVAPNASITGGTNTKITYDSKGLVTAGTQAAASDLSNGTTGSGSIVLSTSPTLTTPNLGVASSTSETISGTAGNGFLELQTQSSAPVVGSTNSIRLFSNATGGLAWRRQTDGFNRNLASVLTADRTYTLPDASGTIPVSASGNIALSASGNISFTGTLPVSNGGTGTTTTFTQGSVLFSGASGIYNQNNANFFWDNTNSRLGLGNAAPGSTLDVKGTLRLSGSTSGYVGFTPAAAAGSTTYTLPSTDGSSGQLLSTNGSGILSWASASATAWGLTGTAGTNASTNFIGTTDNQDLVFKVNNIERARLISSSGDVKIGDATSGTFKATKELVMREDGDTYGSSILRLRNRVGENGAIFETTDSTAALVDFIFKNALNQRNIRYEGRTAYSKVGIPAFHIGGANPDIPNLAVGDSYSAFNTNLKIGNFTTPTEALDVTGNVRFSGALMPNNNAGTSGNALVSNGASTAPTWSKIGLTTHVSGILPIANGGTNSSTALNNNRIMVSNAGAIKEASALTDGQILIGSTGAAPVAANITAGNGISITNGPGSIQISSLNTTNTVLQTSGTTTMTTTSTTDVSFSTPVTLTVPANGDYMIFFNGIVSNSNSGKGVILSLYINGTKIAAAETENTASGNDKSTASITYFASNLSSSQTVEIKWRVESNTGTITKRNFILQRIN
jgi:hypothetical protein